MNKQVKYPNIKEKSMVLEAITKSSSFTFLLIKNPKIDRKDNM